MTAAGAAGSSGPQTEIMGVVNVTPDSFVADIRTPAHDDAIQRVHQLVADGATIIDIGGESTRPGAVEVPADVQLDRVLPVIEAVRDDLPAGIRLSIDTRDGQVVRAAVGAGVDIVNDMSSTLAGVAGGLGAGYVAAHMQGTPDTMQERPSYDAVVDQVFAEVTAAARLARDRGADPVWIDPGIGFGKTIDHNLDLVAHIDRFVAGEFPVLIGVSRKRHTGLIHGASDAGVALGQADPTPTDDRLEASLALALWCATQGVAVLRVHDVSQTAQALQIVTASLDRAAEPS